MDNTFPRMLYKAGGTEAIHGGKFSTLIVADEGAQEAAIADGWSLTTDDAKAVQEAAAKAAEDANRPPTREEMLQKAEELGLEVNARWGDKRLADEITAKLKG
jgi:hypothetical protein